MPKRPIPPPAVPAVRPQLDGKPSRAVTSLNLRYEEKADFDLLQAHWSRKAGRSLKQWDVFSLVLALALEHPAADVPHELKRLS